MYYYRSGGSQRFRRGVSASSPSEKVKARVWRASKLETNTALICF